MYGFVQLKQVKARLGELVVEFQLLQHRWPIEAQRRSIEHSILWILRSVTEFVKRLDERRIDSYDKGIARVVQDAYLSIYLPTIRLIPQLEDDPGCFTELPSTEQVSFLLGTLHDLIEPACRHADAVLRQDVMATLAAYERTNQLPTLSVTAA